MWLWWIACSVSVPEPEPPPEWRLQLEQWKHPQSLPDLPLVDQDGAAFSLGSLRDRWVLVGFIFTRCEKATACPLTMAQQAGVQQSWTSADPALSLLTLTIDPEYDTPERLRAYGERFGADFSTWTLATGDPELMTTGLPSLFNILALPSDGGFDHTVKLALLRPGLLLEREWKDGEFTVASLRETMAKASPK